MLICRMCINPRVEIALEGGCNSKPCNGQRQGCQGRKVGKPCKNDMDVNGNVHELKTKSMHATVHVMKKAKTKTVGKKCAQL